MRLRKTMKRTAAAVLALSMAVSAAAIPASAGYTIDMSDEKITGNVEIKQETDGSGTKITISVDGKDRTTEFTDDEADDKITITGDNTVTKPAAATTADAEAAKDDTKAPETTVEENKDGTVIDYTGKLDAQPEQEASRPEGTAPDMEADPAGVDDQQEETDPEADKDDPDSQNDQNNQSGQNDQNEDSEDEDADADIMTFEAPAPTTLTSAVEAAARKVISIINNATGKELAVTLKNLKVDAGDTAQDAMTIEGKGNVTLELDGDTELKGSSQYKVDKKASECRGGHGLNSEALDGVLTIRDENEEKGTLTAIGGSVESPDLAYSSNYDYLSGGTGINASSLVLSGVKVKAEGGSSTVGSRSGTIAHGGHGIVTTSMSKKTWNYYTNPRSEILNSDVTVKGGDATGKNNMQVNAGDGLALSGNVKIEGSSISATGGSAETTSSTKSASTGTAMGISGEKSGAGTYSLSLKDSILNLFGGHAKSKAYSAVSEALYIGNFNRKDKTMEDLTITVKEGSGEVSGSNGTIANGRGAIFGNGSGATIGGNSTIDVIGSKVKGITAGDNTVMNIYVPKGETADVSNAKVSEDGKIYVYDGAKVTENEDGTITADGTISSLKKGSHNYTVASTTEPTCTTPGKRVYTCTTEGHTDDTYEETIDALGHEFENGVCNRCGAPEQAAAENGGSSAVTLTVTGAEAYETSVADGRYIIAVPAETAVLSGCLGNLRELKEQDVTTIVFRTQLRETALNIDSMLSLGVDDTLFTLTHSGESAELTVGGFAHNELLH